MIPKTHTFTIIQSSGLDSWGEPVTGATIQVEGNLRSKMKTISISNGKEVVSVATVLLEGFVDINFTSTIQFVEPNGLVRKYLPLEVHFMRGLSGEVEFTKVTI